METKTFTLITRNSRAVAQSFVNAPEAINKLPTYKGELKALKYIKVLGLSFHRKLNICS